MNKLILAAAIGAMMQGCSSRAPTPVQNAVTTERQAVAPAPAPIAKQPERAIVDPRSTQAALDVAQGFVRLLDERKFDEAYMRLGPDAPARADFDKQFSRLSDMKAMLGSAGDQEGAAGSIYISIPLTVSATSGGKRTSRSAAIIMRRVNDVPGSTEAQRRWHIERIDWDDAR